MTDALTGICNRHGFDEQVEQYEETESAKALCCGNALIYDDFKLVDDMYGHAAGDGALKKHAESIKQYFFKRYFTRQKRRR
ncbi:MAG: diguanylate cyclase [Victivallales bacterium]